MLFFVFSVSPLLFLFGTYAHSPNPALPRLLLAPTAYHRGAWYGTCVRQGISLALIRSSFPRRIACRLLDSGGGEGAEVTLVRHMTQGVLSRFGRSDSDKGHDSPGPIYSFNLTTSEAPSSET